MAEPPNVPNIPFRDAYGDYNLETADGKYYFEWTPFTPAIRAWDAPNGTCSTHVTGWPTRARSKASRSRSRARLRAIQRPDEAAHRRRGRGDPGGREVVQVLETANTDYATAHDASYEEYQRLRDVIDQTLEDQGRRRL